MSPQYRRSHTLPSLEPEVYARILDGVSDGVYVTDRDRRILYWNKACEEITGYPAERAVGTCCFDNLLVHVAARRRELCTDGCPVAATFTDGEPREAEVLLHHAEGHRVPVRVRPQPLRLSTGEMVAVVETFDSIEEKMAALEEVRELKRLAYVDCLTGIGNRRLLAEQLDLRGAEAERCGWYLGVIMMDIDLFKNINDTAGHEVGDLVLQMVARTLRASTRSFDVVGRWGGEEFVALVVSVDLTELERIAERYRVLVEKSALTTDGGNINVTISEGATLVQEGESPRAAFARADHLMYLVKQAGRDHLTVG
jgi:diguanylate cyclase (GGDEF)-like protein/PAS domain S-box-containing protein